MIPHWMTRLVYVMLPWPSPSERRHAISAARRDRIAAERKAQEAKQVEDNLRQAVYGGNHIAEAIAATIRGKR